MNTQRVQVGEHLPDGTFDGEYVEFEGREVDRWEGVVDSIDPGDQFGATLRLYECPDGYRVHEFIWALSRDRESESSLYPVVGYLGYGTYIAEEAKEKWGKYFSYL